jgi:hypothetical protein
MGLPYIPGAIRSLLLADPVFAARCGNRCSIKKAPPDVTQPFAVVQLPGNITMDGQGWAFKPLVQVNAWCVDAFTQDPDTVTWDLIDAAIEVFNHARYVTVTDSRGTTAYSVRLTDGPLPTEDTSRGDAAPLQGYLIRAELTAQRN